MSNSDESGARVVRPFVLDEWLDSVEGETIVVDAPDRFPNVAACFYMPPWARPHSEFWCSECDAMRFPVFDDWEANKHCPVCENVPGALELGTDGTYKDVKPNEI